MEIRKFIDERWSPRAFADKAIENNTLKSLFKDAGRSPSSSNEQPWRFIVGKAGSKTFDLIFDTLVEFNQAWVKTAPVLAIGIVKKDSIKTGKPNPHARYDLGAALAHLTMSAFDENIYVHQMAGFDEEKCDTVFNIPQEYETVVAFCMGYKGDKNQLHEKIAAMENGVSKRKELDEYVFEDDWSKEVNW